MGQRDNNSKLTMDTPDIIPYEYVTRSLSFDPRKSTFTTFLESVLDPLVVEGLVEQYQLGVTKAGDVISSRLTENAGAEPERS
jgi:hypothetical protein